jgi:hypothetical protein
MAYDESFLRRPLHRVLAALIYGVPLLLLAGSLFHHEAPAAEQAGRRRLPLTRRSLGQAVARVSFAASDYYDR